MVDALRNALDGLGNYPATAGTLDLRAACAGWLERRFGLPAGAVDPAHMVLPVNGTREALFAIAQAVIDTSGPSRPIRTFAKFHSTVPGFKECVVHQW